MLGIKIPTPEEIKAMADDELQKFVDSLKAREQDLFAYLDSHKVIVTFEKKEKS